MNQQAALTPSDVADLLQLSESYVYKHWRELGGVKIGQRVRFPRWEELHGHLLCQRQGVALSLQVSESEVHEGLVQNKKGGKQGGGRVQKFAQKPSIANSDRNRHNLFRPNK